jgi:drug/metabolite transporter (DMT)-like permease
MPPCGLPARPPDDPAHAARMPGFRMELTLGVTLAVLGAGFLHAGWNALLKSAAGGDPLLDTACVVAGSTACALAALPFVSVPLAAAWPFAAASVAIHFGYYLTLAQAYRTGDLSFAYPLMRGTAPLLVTLLSIVFLREWPSAHVTAGIVLICGGIVLIAFSRRAHHAAAAVGWALANAALIACYTLVDGAGARASGGAAGYVLWLTLFEGVAFLAWIRWHRGIAAARYVGRQWRRGLAAGFGSVAAYGIVLWAMTQAPVAAVAALRETSVLFAALIGALWLKEGFGAVRLAGAASVVAGVAALKL